VFAPRDVRVPGPAVLELLRRPPDVLRRALAAGEPLLG
jgi:hypothetical protein